MNVDDELQAHAELADEVAIFKASQLPHREAFVEQKLAGQPWHDLARWHPYMDRVIHSVSVNGMVVDTKESPLGIRNNHVG